MTVKVAGRGADHPDVLIVGEAPGRHEDIAGEASVGPSGKFLDRCLADAGFRAAELRLSNAVRCRPQEDMTPYPEEVDACRNHLRAEILETQPRLIVALGDVALRSLLKVSGIGTYRGKSYPLHADFGIPNVEVWPTYHPAYAMRPEGLHARETIVSDLRRIRASATPEEHVAWSKWEGQPLRGGLIAYDIETYDAEGAILDHPTQIAIAQRIEGKPVIWVSQDVQALTEAIRVAQAGGSWTGGHNCWDFDTPKLREYHVAALADGLDTMTLAYLDGEQQPRSLEALAVKYNGARGWKEDDAEKKLGDCNDPNDRLSRYNGQDAYQTLLLIENLWRRLGSKRQLLASMLWALRRTLDECSERGLYIDKAEVARVKPIFQEQIDREFIALQRIAGDDWKEDEPKRPYKPGQLHNPGKGGKNDEVVRVVLKRGLAGFLRRSPKTGKPSVDKLALNNIVEAVHDEYAIANLAYRHATKRMSTYVLPYEIAANSEDGRVHCTYTHDRVATNRTSARGPNVQNLERDLHFFIAEPGKFFVKADLGSVEFRTGAWCAHELNIIERYRQNPAWDPHSWLASFAFNMPEDAIRAEHKAQVAQGINNTKRQMAKSANFSQEYFGTAATLVDYSAKSKPPIFLTWEQAQYLHMTFHRAFPSFNGWWFGHVTEQLDKHGFIETATGFRRHFDGFSSLRGPVRLDAIRQAANCLSQTLAAHIAYIGLIELRARHYPVNGFFHDAVGLEFDSRDRFQIARADITDAMTVHPIKVLKQHFGVDFTVPLVIGFSADE